MTVFRTNFIKLQDWGMGKHVLRFLPLYEHLCLNKHVRATASPCKTLGHPASLIPPHPRDSRSPGSDGSLLTARRTAPATAPFPKKQQPYLRCEQSHSLASLHFAAPPEYANWPQRALKIIWGVLVTKREGILLTSLSSHHLKTQKSYTSVG